MDFSLSEEQTMYQDMVRKFAVNEIKPAAMGYDQKSDPEESVPLELTRQGFEQGFHQMIVPTHMGGTGLDALTSLVILEELAAGAFPAKNGWSPMSMIRPLPLSPLDAPARHTKRLWPGPSSVRSSAGRSSSTR
jgi:alkylation response protein AidB-like acyl-CoA dehydrogenase